MAKPPAKERPKKPRPVSKPVRFEEAAILRARFKPPFANDEGNYTDPDIVIAGGELSGPVPEAIACESQLVIYSSWADFVPSCKGFGGPNDGNNAIVQTALANARAVAARIKCDGDCTRRVFQIWRGWSCGPEQNMSLAFGAVEVMILCRDEL